MKTIIYLSSLSFLFIFSITFSHALSPDIDQKAIGIEIYEKINTPESVLKPVIYTLRSRIIKECPFSNSYPIESLPSRQNLEFHIFVISKDKILKSYLKYYRRHHVLEKFLFPLEEKYPKVYSCMTKIFDEVLSSTSLKDVKGLKEGTSYHIKLNFTVKTDNTVF